MRPFVLLLAAALVGAAAPVPAPGSDVTIAITNVKAKGGTMRVALYDKGPLYGVPPAYLGEVKVVAPGELAIVVRNVVPGDYVVSAFHDADDDGKLGMANGKLIEGTALSNADKLRGAPSFDVTKVMIPAGTSRTVIAMSYPEDRTGG